MQRFIRDKGIERSIIYRSVDKPNTVIPFDENGNALRFGTEGDRPSAFRAIYFLLFAVCGINLLSIAGYLYGKTSLIVTRNQETPDDCGGEYLPLHRATTVTPAEIEDIDSLLKKPEAEAFSQQPPAEVKEVFSLDEEDLPVHREQTSMPSAETEDIATLLKKPEVLELERVNFTVPPKFGKVVYVNSDPKKIKAKNAIIVEVSNKKPLVLKEEDIEKKIKTSKQKKETELGRELLPSEEKAIKVEIEKKERERQRSKTDLLNIIGEKFIPSLDELFDSSHANQDDSQLVEEGGFRRQGGGEKSKPNKKNKKTQRIKILHRQTHKNKKTQKHGNTRKQGKAKTRKNKTPKKSKKLVRKTRKNL